MNKNDTNKSIKLESKKKETVDDKSMIWYELWTDMIVKKLIVKRDDGDFSYLERILHVVLKKKLKVVSAYQEETNPPNVNLSVHRTDATIKACRPLNNNPNDPDYLIIIEFNSHLTPYCERKNLMYHFTQILDNDTKGSNKPHKKRKYPRYIVLINFNIHESKHDKKPIKRDHLHTMCLKDEIYQYCNVDVDSISNSVYNNYTETKEKGEVCDKKLIAFLRFNRTQWQEWAEFDEEAKKLFAEIEAMNNNEEYRKIFASGFDPEADKESYGDMCRDEALEEGKQIGLEKGEQIGLEKGEQIGLEKGLEKGREEVLENTAKNLYAMDMSDEVVQKATGLSKSKLKSIRMMML